MTDSSCLSIDFSFECMIFTPQMAPAVGTKLVSLILYSSPYLAFSGLGLFVGFVAQIFTSIS
jgi:hypothetical protein